MEEPQTNSISKMKKVNIMIGCLIAILTFGLIVYTVRNAYIVESYQPQGTISEAIKLVVFPLFIILAIILLVKFCLDVCFVYSVVNERPVRGYVTWVVLFVISMLLFYFMLMFDPDPMLFSTIGMVYFCLNIYLGCIFYNQRKGHEENGNVILLVENNLDKLKMTD